MGEDYSDELLEEMAELQEKIDAGDLWDLDTQLEMAMDALRCPPGDCRRSPTCRAARSAASR